MVVLKTLKCAACGKQSGRAFIDGYSSEPLACSGHECDTLICGTCRHGLHICPRHGPNCLTEPIFLSKICTLVNSAPEDELRLIDLQIALNDNCSKCNCRGGNFNRYSIQQVVCSKCDSSQSWWWEVSSLTERLFRKIISELNELAMPKTRIQRKGVDGILPVKIVVKCKACKQGFGTTHSTSSMLDGEPHCYGCGRQVYQYFPVSRRCDCLSILINFIQCIPENQLYLLTYSKWLKAVGCTKHQEMLYELTAVSADGSTGKLRSFFKKENDDIQKNPLLENMSLNSSKPVAQAANEHKKKLETLMSNLDLSTPNKLLSARITCSCGREDELSNMFDCFTCSACGMCALCLANKHWGHEMNKSLNTLALCLIDSQSEVARQKLSTWTEHAKELSQQNEKAFEKLSRVLGGVFKEAATKSGDIQRIQTLLTKTSTSDLEPFIRNANSGTKLLNERIDSFCDKLLKAVEEEAQIDQTTTQENSPADQK